ncbi:cysteine dioxygenase [Kaistella polysaccharea]|uniref:cysteine dioxygenase n=1 Tax=Kaistella polysaccharea TaxID=2878534 RepID=UPI001CF4B6C7|nr:cysteine dioxygenase family protein [Kaistella polysaccharea]
MKTPPGLQNLEQVLADLKAKKNLSFEEICDLLFTFQFKDFDELFQITPLEVPDETFMRVPIYHGDFVAALKIWGVNHYSAIRDHSNYDAKIKVLKGSLTEVSYRENMNFIEYDSRAIARVGDILVEEQTDINSMINNSEGISVSLHVYRTPKLRLENVRIFDTEQRRIAHLSNLAKSCSWIAPENSYKKIAQI